MADSHQSYHRWDYSQIDTRVIACTYCGFQIKITPKHLMQIRAAEAQGLAFPHAVRRVSTNIIRWSKNHGTWQECDKYEKEWAESLHNPDNPNSYFHKYNIPREYGVH